jgi:tetratricopeptide (TPR) repeat protein
LHVLEANFPVAFPPQSQPWLKLANSYLAFVKPEEGKRILTEMTQQKGDIPKAVQAYEQALALNPRSALTGNNLAYLYSEHGGDKEKALQLAQMAKEEAPAEPRVSDTLGWILYKRGVQRALALL